MDGSRPTVVSGDALFAVDGRLHIVSWNERAEQLTGLAADEVVGRACWEVLGGRDDDGALVCHAGCSSARLARERFPVPARALSIRTRGGRRRVRLSTVTVDHGGEPLLLHLFRNGPEHAEPGPGRLGYAAAQPHLTARQLQVLRELAAGAPAKVIARRLGLAEATIRNHIRAILVELGAHSQLEAVAKARGFRLV